MKPSFSVVVPCYRSEKSLPELVERLCSTFEPHDYAFEIILVNDGSPDNTWNTIAGLVKENPKVVGIDLARNFGQQSAVLAGFEHARNDYVVTMDDDLQNRPEDIIPMFNHMRDHDCDVVIAHLQEKKHGFIRGLGTKLVQRISMMVLHIPKDFKFSSFRVLTNQVAKDALKFKVANPVVGFLILQATNRVTNFEVGHDQRKYGKSNYSFDRLINYCATMLLDYSVIPLKMVGYMGLFIALGSFILGVYYFTLWSIGGIGVSGFTTSGLLMCLFFGLLFMTLGVIGAYLIRILRNSNHHPLYLVRGEALRHTVRGGELGSAVLEERHNAGATASK